MFEEGILFESNVESYSYKTYLMDGVSFCQV